MKESIQQTKQLARTIQESSRSQKVDFVDNRPESIIQRNIKDDIVCRYVMPSIGGENKFTYRNGTQLSQFNSNIVQRVIQMDADLPSSITVVFNERNEIVRVYDNEGHDILFAIFDHSVSEYEEGTVVITPKKLVARFATVKGDYGSLTKIKSVKKEIDKTSKEKATSSSIPSSEPSKPKPGLTKEDIKISLEGERSLFIKGMGLTGFESTSQSGDQGRIHFEKHKDEFDPVPRDKGAYVRMGQSFGRSPASEFIEVTIKKTKIRFDPRNGYVLIASNKLIRTFYVWDQTYRNPVAYAVYYTITNNMRIPLGMIEQSVVELFSSKGIDLFAMEREIIVKKLRDKVAPAEISNETLAPISFIQEVKRRLEMEATIKSTQATHPNLTGTTDPRRQYDIQVKEVRGAFFENASKSEWNPEQGYTAYPLSDQQIIHLQGSGLQLLDTVPDGDCALNSVLESLGDQSHLFDIRNRIADYFLVLHPGEETTANAMREQGNDKYSNVMIRILAKLLDITINVVGPEGEVYETINPDTASIIHIYQVEAGLVGHFYGTRK